MFCNMITDYRESTYKCTLPSYFRACCLKMRNFLALEEMDYLATLNMSIELVRLVFDEIVAKGKEK